MAAVQNSSRGSDAPVAAGSPVQREDQDENTPLLGDTGHNGRFILKVKSKFKSRHCCLWSSKAALLILIWNLIVSFSMMCFFDPSLYTAAIFPDSGIFILGVGYGITSFLFLFYPLAGYLADVKWGRHITVVNSLCFVFWTPIMLMIVGSLVFIAFIPSIADTPLSDTVLIITIVVICLVFGIPAMSGALLLLCSLVTFSANVIQYGMDQLHDAPADDSVLYIHWYVWTSYVGSFLIRLPSAVTMLIIRDPGPDLSDIQFAYLFSPLLLPIAFVFLGVTLCLQRYKRHWFLIESGFKNPYRLVYKVVKFASKHKDPIRRSAFTYCEDELPSRFDLGKEKYGGPFTTEEVENVKAFVGILSVLLTIGPTFVADIALNGDLLDHSIEYFNSTISTQYTYFYHSGILTPLMIVILIPFYLSLLRPFIHSRIPGMLKRIGLGLILLMLSVLCNLLMDSIFGRHHHKHRGILNYVDNNPHLFLIQFSLNAVGYMLLYISTYEFICAQSPHSMKGLLIGTFFAIKGFFQSFGALVLYTPINRFCFEGDFPLCGFIYYALIIVVLLIGIVAYAVVARKYQYRQRDEPDNIYRYAEEYYANAQDEPNYDYDDYDNLNVETLN